MKNSFLKLRSLLALLIFSLVSVSALAQSFGPKSITTTGKSHGFYEYLPEGYSSGGSYPLLIAIHGVGELGNGKTTLSKLERNGIPALIKRGLFPKSFRVNGKDFRFIVLAPQFVSWPAATDVDAFVEYAIRTYKVDRSRIYITGLSMGGGATWEYAGHVKNNYVAKLAAIVPVCGASYNDKSRSNIIADGKLPVWALHNVHDPTVTVRYTEGYIANILARNPSAPVKKTIFNTFSHDAWTQSYNPNFRENGMNIYEWMLQYTSSRGPAPAPPAPANKQPVSDPGATQNLTLPSNAIYLDGSKSYDPDGSISKYSWSKISGPAQFTLTSSTSVKATVSNLAAGTYVFRLTVTDNKGATATKDKTVIVAPASNKKPVANAGPDANISLPTSSYTMKASGSDPDGKVSAYVWSKVSGPAQFSVSSLSSPTSTLSNMVAGTYVFRLTVTDDKGLTATDDMTINVRALTSLPAITVNAGNDVRINLPINYSILAGSSNGGAGVKYSWSKISGGNVNIVTPTSSKTNILYMTAGTYVFELAATKSGVTARDRITVTVAGTSAPALTANAGSDVSIALPTNYYILKGSSNGGTDVKYNWTKISGGNVTLVTPTLSKSNILFMTAGTYVFELAATKSGVTARDRITVSIVGSTTTPPASTNSKVINVNVAGSTNLSTDAAWNNWNVVKSTTSSSSNITSGVFKYSTGASSGVTAHLNHSEGVILNQPYSGGMAPLSVLQTTSYSTVYRTLTLKGLQPGKIYDIELYASRAKNDNPTLFSLGGVIRSVNPDNNTTNKAQYTNVKSTSAGVITINIAKTKTYNYINGFRITEKSAASAQTLQSGPDETVQFNTDPERFGVGVNSIRIFPNPVESQFQLTVNNEFEGTMQVAIVDAAGRTIQKTEIQKTAGTITKTILLAPGFKTGIYFVRLQSGTDIKVEKIFKK